ncbi:EKC/KEOPS complex subunit BUD32 [Abortiporus biennis]
MQRQGDFMKGKENHDKDMITQSLHRLKCDYKLDTGKHLFNSPSSPILSMSATEKSAADLVSLSKGAMPVVLMLGSVDAKTEFICDFCELDTPNTTLTMRTIQPAGFPFKITVIDTPGFTNFERQALINSLEAIRRSITKPSYPSKIDGIIYFHRIDDCDTASYSYEHIFQPAASIFGITDAHLAIVVTGWESEEMTPLGMERREKKLKDDPILFRPILEKKAKMLSYRRNSDSHSVMNDIIVHFQDLPPALFMTDVLQNLSDPLKITRYQNVRELAELLDALSLDYSPLPALTHDSQCLVCVISPVNSDDKWCSDRCKNIDGFHRQLYRTLTEADDVSIEDKPRWLYIARGFVLPHDEQVKLIEELCKANAELAINGVQTITDSIEIKCADSIQKAFLEEFHRLTRRLLMKLTIEASMIPYSLLISDVFQTKKEMVSGGLADIFEGTFKGQAVALKCLREFASMPKYLKEETTKSLCHELLTWKNMKHDHIIPLLGLNDMVSKQPCIVIPWMQNGHIIQRISQLLEDEKMSNKEGNKEANKESKKEGIKIKIHEWMCEILRALEYLHYDRIVHGDLRGNNILVDENDHIRLTDFGMAVYADATSKAYGSMRGGNQAWMAPEQLNHDRVGVPSSRPTPQSDMYSFGCVCIELYTGNNPRKIESNPHAPLPAHIQEQVLKGILPELPSFHHTSERMETNLWNAVKHCLAYHPKDRPDASQLVIDMEAIFNQGGVYEDYGLNAPGLGNRMVSSRYLSRQDSLHIRDLSLSTSQK